MQQRVKIRHQSYKKTSCEFKKKHLLKLDIKFIQEHQPILGIYAHTKDFFITGRANLIFCAFGLR